MLGNVRARVAGVCVVAGLTLLGLGILGPSATAVVVALSGWTQQGGDANWQVQSGGQSVYVVAPTNNFDNANGPPSFFVSPNNVGGTFRVTISPNADSAGEESDYIGFAVGYVRPVSNEECSNANQCNTAFYLFDWKKDTEIEGGTALPPEEGGQEGFSLMRVFGPRDLQNNNTPDHPNCFWTHEDVNGSCDVLGTRYGPNEGYDFGVSYTFEVTYVPNRIRIDLLGTGGAAPRTLFSVSPPGGTTFQPGRFAFYNYSQPEAEYFFDDGTAPPPTSSTSTTSSTTTSTTVAGGSGTTTPPTVGPVIRSSIVRTGPNSLLTALQLTGGALLLMTGAVLTATRGKRPEGRYYL